MRGKGRTFSIILLSFLIAALLLINTTVNATTNEEEIEKILALGFDEYPDSVNPFRSINDVSQILHGMIYDYLISPDENLNSKPNLASSWWCMDGIIAASQQNPTDFSTFEHNISPDDWPLGSIWEYNLTEHVFWNDGIPFTAYDVEWTFNRLSMRGIYCCPYWKHLPYTQWIDHTEAVNATKIRVFFSDRITEQPIPISWGESLNIPIMPKHIFEHQPYTYLPYDWDGVPAIGTGPFIIEESLRDWWSPDFIKLIPNPYYNFIDTEDDIRKGLGAAYNRTIEIDRIRMKFFSDMNTLRLAVRTGQVDASIIESGTYLQWVSEKENGTLPSEITLVCMYPCTGYTKEFGFNTYADAPGTLNALRLDPAVHRAAALATNKSFILKSVYSNLGEPGTGIIATRAWPEWYWEPGNETSWFNLTDGNGDIIPEGSYNKSMKDVMDFDLDLANDILDAAGYVWTGEVGNSVREAGPLVGERMQHLFPDKFTNPSVIDGETLQFEMVIAMTEADDRRVGLYITEEWKNIGINASSLYVDDPTWDQLVYSYTFNIMFTYWSGDVDPNYLCYITTTMSLFGWNEFGTNDPEYDQLFYNQAKAQNYTERKYWVDECSKWQYLSGSIITFVYPEICYAYRNDTWTNWGNWTEHPGMALDAYWGENPLWFNLQYVIEERVSIGQWMTIGIIVATIAIVVALIFYFLRPKKGSPEVSSVSSENV